MVSLAWVLEEVEKRRTLIRIRMRNVQGKTLVERLGLFRINYPTVRGNYFLDINPVRFSLYNFGHYISSDSGLHAPNSSRSFLLCP